MLEIVNEIKYAQLIPFLYHPIIRSNQVTKNIKLHPNNLDQVKKLYSKTKADFLILIKVKIIQSKFFNKKCKMFLVYILILSTKIQRQILSMI